LPEIFSLGLQFKKSVYIPDWLGKIRIGRLDIYGSVSESEKGKIIRMFPNTDLRINREKYNFGNNNWIEVSGSIPITALKKNEIWVLQIWDREFLNTLANSDEIKNIKIQNLLIVNRPSRDIIEKIRMRLPQTKIYFDGEKLP
jgi:hypothetical protein